MLNENDPIAVVEQLNRELAEQAPFFCDNNPMLVSVEFDGSYFIKFAGQHVWDDVENPIPWNDELDIPQMTVLAWCRDKINILAQLFAGFYLSGNSEPRPRVPLRVYFEYDKHPDKPGAIQQIYHESTDPDPLVTRTKEEIPPTSLVGLTISAVTRGKHDRLVLILG